MIPSSPRSPRKVNKAITEIIPEIKLQEPQNKKQYHRNSEQLGLGTVLRIIMVVGMIIGAFILGIRVGFGDFEATIGMRAPSVPRDPMITQCQLVPDMEGCEAYNSGNNLEISHNSNNTTDEVEYKEYCQTHQKLLYCKGYNDSLISKDPTKTYISNTGNILAGKTGDDLDRAFLETMIDYRTGVIELANYLTGAKHPELQALGKNLINSQIKEIEIMKKWQRDWGYKVIPTPPDKIAL